jgi:hypothetical protein
MLSAKLIKYVEDNRDATEKSPTHQILGVTPGRLKQLAKADTELSELQMARLLLQARAQAKKQVHEHAIQAIVEFFPIMPTRAGGNADKLSVFDTRTANSKYRTDLLQALKDAKSGLYVFYDTRGRAIYAGQTKKQNIWKEMNLAFNRDRSTQVVTLVKHPVNNIAFEPAHKSRRQLVDRTLKMHDLAAYFSAYAVIPEMVDDLEALLVRAFPNDLTNFKMERLGKAQHKAQKAAAVKKAGKAPLPAKAARRK